MRVGRDETVIAELSGGSFGFLVDCTTGVEADERSCGMLAGNNSSGCEAVSLIGLHVRSPAGR